MFYKGPGGDDCDGPAAGAVQLFLQMAYGGYAPGDAPSQAVPEAHTDSQRCYLDAKLYVFYLRLSIKRFFLSI